MPKRSSSDPKPSTGFSPREDLPGQAEFFPQTVHLLRSDPEKHMHRYYRLTLSPDLMGGARLTREWGRVGFSGRSVTEHYPDMGQASDALHRHLRRKEARGYQVVP